MAIIIERILCCDKCSVTFSPGATFSVETSLRMRLDAEDDGWINKGSRDYCPDCVRQHNISKYRRVTNGNLP